MTSPSTSPIKPPSPDPPVAPGESLVLPVDEEMLDEFLHAGRHGAIGTNSQKAEIPWWKTPSPWWLLCIMPLTAIGFSATLAPRVEVYTLLACRAHSPDIFGSASENMWQAQLPAQYSPTRHQRCASDPFVQAAVAKLIAVIAATAGILSCLTGAWWGALSDRYGRKSVLCITVLGGLMSDINFILVTLFTDKFPGGYWFLLAGPLIEGALGGMTGGAAATHAYMADTTTEASRSRVFSMNLGLLFTGFAIGPTIGSLLVRFTGQPISVFFLAASLHLTYALFVSLAVPESITKDKMQAARNKHEDLSRESTNTLSVARYVRGLFRFLAPLAVLAPMVKNSGRGGKDWTLTFIILAYGLAISLLGFSPYVLQYAASTYQWTSEALGYYITLVGTVRAVVLMAAFPAVVKFLRPKPIIVEIPWQPSEDEPLLSGRNADSASPATMRKELHSPAFDLNVARISLAIEAIAFGTMSLALGAVPFTLFAMLGSAGSCFNPALQSAALTIYTRNGQTESGRLFGAISVVQALSFQIIAPSLYGAVYAKTVAWFPRSIFVVAFTTVIASLVCLSIVHLPSDILRNVVNSDVEDLVPGSRGDMEISVPAIEITTADD